jgi:hypothetical protein
MDHAISGFFQNNAGHWVAKLACKHELQFQHNPPEANNAWVLTQTGRDDKIGVLLFCVNCLAGMNTNRQISNLLEGKAV